MTNRCLLNDELTGKQCLPLVDFFSYYVAKQDQNTNTRKVAQTPLYSLSIYWDKCVETYLYKLQSNLSCVRISYTTFSTSF